MSLKNFKAHLKSSNINFDIEENYQKSVLSSDI